MLEQAYYTYILTNTHNTGIYTGITNDLLRRVGEHRLKLLPGFTQRYNIHKLVFFETTNDVQAAIGREKQIKSWPRRKKNDLITAMNPDWKDLYEGLTP